MVTLGRLGSHGSGQQGVTEGNGHGKVYRESIIRICVGIIVTQVNSNMLRFTCHGTCSLCWVRKQRVYSQLRSREAVRYHHRRINVYTKGLPSSPEPASRCNHTT